MEISNVLSSLISAGPDAPANLYLVNFFERASKEEASLSNDLTIRTNNFIIPPVAINTLEFPYMNDVYHKPVPSSAIDKIGSFSLRIDKYFKCYNFIKEKVAVDENGDWLSEGNLKDLLIDSITVSQVKDDDLFTPIKTWKYYNCFILNISSFTYDYKTSDPLSVTVKFTWGNLKTT